MKNFDLLGKTYEVPASSEKFLSDYINRIEKYVSQNNIDSEYLQDIQARIIEKLDILEFPIQQSDIINVVNDLGEPEDIFLDIKDLMEHEGKETKKKEGWLSQRKKILFGVALRLSDDLSIPVLYIRVIFLLLAFLAGVGIWLYLGLAMLLSGIFNFSTTKNQNPSLLSVVFRKMISSIKILGKWIVGGGILCIAFFLLLGGIIGSIVGINLFEQWIIDGQYIFSIITPAIRVTLLIGSVLILLIAFGLTTFVFQKSIFGRYIWSILIFLFLGISIVFLSALPPIFQDFSRTYEKNVQIYDLGYIGSGELSIAGYVRRGGESSGYLTQYNFIYEKSATGLTVEVETRLRGQGDLVSRLTKMNPLSIIRNGDSLNITSPDENFTEVVPLTFTEYYITIYVPKNILIKNEHGQVQNSYRTELENYTNYGGYECEYSRYIYDDKREKFFCDPSGYPKEFLENVMKQYANELDVGKYIDNIPIHTGDIIASGSYSIETYYDERSGKEKMISVEIYINGSGNIWALEK